MAITKANSGQNLVESMIGTTLLMPALVAMIQIALFIHLCWIHQMRSAMWARELLYGEKQCQAWRETVLNFEIEGHCDPQQPGNTRVEIEGPRIGAIGLRRQLSVNWAVQTGGAR